MIIREGKRWLDATGRAVLALALASLVGCTPEAKGSRTPGIPISTPPVPLSSSAAQPMLALTPSPEVAPTPLPLTAFDGATPSATSLPDSSTVETGGVAATGEDPAGPAEDSRSADIAPPSGTPLPTPFVPPGAAQSPGPRARVVALDPGHGGPEPGASAAGLVEKDVNLKIALKLAGLLDARGYRVVLTRETDRAVSPEYKGGGYAGGVGRDLQARVDLANAATADLFISIHNNGSVDPDQAGTEVWYNRERSFAERNLTLAKLVQAGLLRQIRALGYPAVDRGIKDDANFRVFRGRAYNIYVLGPGDGARPHIPTLMPGVLGESLFVSNPGDAAMLRRETTLDAIAAGYRDAIVAYFERYP